MNKIQGTTKRPRVSVFRSNRFISAQFVDDEKGATLLSDSSKSLEADKKPAERAFLLGKKLGESAKAKKIETIVFDRKGKQYHGQVKALAEGMREAGLKF